MRNLQAIENRIYNNVTITKGVCKMKKEIQDIIGQFNVEVAETHEEATAIMAKASDKNYTILISGKITKTGTVKYYAICTLKKDLLPDQIVTLATTYLETVVLHQAVRDIIITPKDRASKGGKRKGMIKI